MTSMRIEEPGPRPVCDERDVYESLLSFDGAAVLELGCGAAQKTRAIAEAHPTASILALEVDAIQHEKNLRIADLPNVRFSVGGAEEIPSAEARFDVVLLFRSLHHVPVAQMDRALAEIRRVLRPGGVAYVSEPIFAGALNEIIRLFHDERVVREAAFAAVQRSVASGALELVTQRFFDTPTAYRDFAQFEERMLNVTHTQHRLSPELFAQVKSRFEAHVTPSGARFETPVRVDLLRRPG